MVKVGSLFTQVLSLISRKKFDQTARQHQAERGAKGFSCWSQFVAMMFCHMVSANSLREICDGLATGQRDVFTLSGERFSCLWRCSENDYRG